jgi:cytochrome c-type biogenesis protein CcmH
VTAVIRKILGAAALALCLGLPAAAQQVPSDSAVDAMTRVLAKELRCPVCQGLSIQDSPSELSQEMRDVIRDQLKAGRSPEEVKQYFLGKYGEWILLEPKPSGFNLVVYVVPVLVVLGGLAIVWRAVKRWTVVTPQTRDPAERTGSEHEAPVS